MNRFWHQPIPTPQGLELEYMMASSESWMYDTWERNELLAELWQLTH